MKKVLLTLAIAAVFAACKSGGSHDDQNATDSTATQEQPKEEMPQTAPADTMGMDTAHKM